MEIHRFIHYISLSLHVSGLPPFNFVKFVIKPHHHEANITGPCRVFAVKSKWLRLFFHFVIGGCSEGEVFAVYLPSVTAVTWKKYSVPILHCKKYPIKKIRKLKVLKVKVLILPRDWYIVIYFIIKLLHQGRSSTLLEVVMVELVLTAVYKALHYCITAKDRSLSII